MRRCWSLAMLVLGWGCTADKLSRPVAQFPSRAELEAVAEQAAPPAPPFQTRSVDSWVLKVEAPEPGSAYPSESLWDRQLLQRAREAKLTPSPELRCAARETARFYAENGAFPEQGLRAYVLARCGSTLARTTLQTLTFELDGAKPEAELLSADMRGWDALWAGAQQGAAVGLGFARAGGRASVVLYRGSPGVELDGFSPLVSGDELSLRGRLLGNTASALALVTQGSYGIAICQPDRQLLPPELGFVCPLHARDEQAIVEIVTRTPERLLPTPVSRAMVRRAAGGALTYQPDLSLLAAPGSTGTASGSFDDSLLSALNRLRRAARLEPLALEPLQSELNRLLAPHLLAAERAHDAQQRDQLSLGALAGWDVPGVIRTGAVYAHDEAGSDGSRWLAMALQDPLARYTLLHPYATRIAIGSVAHGQQRQLALVSTYALFDASGHEADESALFDELLTRRTAYGMTAPQRRARSQELTRALEQIASGQLSSGEAMEWARTATAERTNLSVQGKVVETSDLSLVPLPKQLMASGALEVEIGVAHYKPNGGAWGQYAVIYLFTATPDGKLRRSELPALCRKRVVQSGSMPVEELPADWSEVPARTGHALLTINPHNALYRAAVPAACVPRGDDETATVRICVASDGKVAGVRILKESLPIIDSQLPLVIRRWTYQPYLVDGKAIPFCYSMRYQVK